MKSVNDNGGEDHISMMDSGAIMDPLSSRRKIKYNSVVRRSTTSNPHDQAISLHQNSGGKEDF